MTGLSSIAMSPSGTPVAAGMTLPTATVVVPTFNRPERLAACLRALANLDYPAKRLSIEIVDDGSPQDLGAVVAAASMPFALRLTRQRNQGPAVARNAGARIATGDLLAFTDDDCLPDQRWLIGLAHAFERSPGALIGGLVQNGVDRICSEASQDLVDFLYQYFNAENGGVPFFTSNNLACSRELFLATGGFDETFPIAAAEDRELGMRWRRQGRDLIFADDALVLHQHDLDLPKFWRQHRNYGFGAHHLHTALHKGGFEKPRFERLNFYLELLAYPVRTYGVRGLPKSVLMLVSQIAMARGFYLREV
ncbi:MAG: glycosyltransferase [Sphingomonadaceae bacterium]